MTDREFTQQATNRPCTTNCNKVRKPNCDDILLNNFQIEKKPHRVLLNCDHIVWERLDAKRNNATKDAKNSKSKLDAPPTPTKDYGSASNVLHTNEVIRVIKGHTKAATFHITTPENSFHVGEATRNTLLIPTEQYLTIHFAERIINSLIDCNRWCVRTLTLYNSDAYIVQQWHLQLSELLKNSSRRRAQRLLVFINPYGGRKQGLQTYERHCKPLFQLAGIDASCIISQRANQIRDMLMSHDLTPFDAICCVGGDGTVAEVVNGLIFRKLQDLGMDARCPEYIPKPTLPIAIIPAGSTDTVAYSLHGTADVRTAAIHLILGQCRGLDICSVRNRSGIVRFCASVLSYGYLGDVAAKSEQYRWMGTKRYEYTGVKTFLSNRGYNAEIRMLCQDDKEDIQSIDSNLNNSIVDDAAVTLDTVCYADCHRCCSAAVNASVCTLQPNRTITKEYNDALPTSSNLSLYARKSSENNRGADCDTNPKIVGLQEQFEKLQQIGQLLTQEQKCDIAGRETEEEEPTSVSDNNGTTIDACSMASSTRTRSKWKVIKGNFFMISCANITCACSKSPNGISRYCHLGDGNLDLILVRKTSLWNALRFALNTMGRNGDIRNLPFVEVYRTRKVRICTQIAGTSSVDDIDDAEFNLSGSCQPIAAEFADHIVTNNTISSWNCDGEVVTDLDITMSSHCQLIDVFMRGPYCYQKPTKKCATSINCCC